MSAERLAGYEDLNFRLDTKRNRNRYLIFKVISESTSIEDIECQHAAMNHLSEKLGKHFRGPNPIASKSGKQIESYEDRHVRILTFSEGTMLADLKNPSIDLFEDLGSKLGQIDHALLDFENPALARDIEWDLGNLRLKKDNIRFIVDRPVKDMLRKFLDRFEQFEEEVHATLRRSAIHNDVNDHNVVLHGHSLLPKGVEAIIDFGDLIEQSLVFDPAIALAYSIMGSDEPLAIAEAFIKGFVKKCPLEAKEIEQIYLLVGARLSQSLLMSAEKQISEPDNEYLQISHKPARDAILSWGALPEALVSHVLKDAAGLPYLEESKEIVEWIDENREQFHHVIFEANTLETFPVLDFSVKSGSSQVLGNNERFPSPSLGRYLEPRLVYQGDQFVDQKDRRTIHLGVDIFSKEGTSVYAALDGIVYGVADNAYQFDYGPTIILEHQTDSGTKFWTLYGHLDRLALKRLKRGQRIEKGALVGNLGSQDVNGNWSPHLHFQLITDVLEAEANFPGVASARYLDIWKKISPNPAGLLGIEGKQISYDLGSTNELLDQRKKSLSPSLSISYDAPIKMVKGEDTRLFSESGEEYLDCVNNVCHVGHSNEVVANALYRQASVLNTNTRYLHDNIVELSKKLTSTLPKGLNVCFFVNSGSEANDLALRLAKAFTGKTDFVVIDSGYHGHTSALIDISPYKFNGKGGSGPGINTSVIPLPDTFRGLYREDHEDPATAYANHVDNALKEISKGKRALAGFVGETILSCGGQIDPPKGYLKKVYKKIRNAGGVCIADEVQTGFGRVGNTFWAFETQGVVPDIVTMGKPMGNGHPLAAVVTTKKIAKAFANGMEYFNTFGGNPVSCAVGLAVLDEIESRELQANAKEVGRYFKKKLKELQEQVECIGQVRGQGLFLGIEFVKDRESRTPDAWLAKKIVEEMKRRKVLLSTDGLENNVIKIKPPITFTKADVDIVIRNLGFVLNLKDDYEIDSSNESELESDLESGGLETVNLSASEPEISDSDKVTKDETEPIERIPSHRENWYGDVKADVVGYDPNIKRRRRSKPSKEKGLLRKLKDALGKD